MRATLMSGAGDVGVESAFEPIRFGGIQHAVRFAEAPPDASAAIDAAYHAKYDRYGPPGEWHWHGAAPDHFMTHVAMWEAPAPDSAQPESEWGDLVTEEEYQSPSG